MNATLNQFNTYSTWWISTFQFWLSIISIAVGDQRMWMGTIYHVFLHMSRVIISKTVCWSYEQCKPVKWNYVPAKFRVRASLKIQLTWSVTPMVNTSTPRSFVLLTSTKVWLVSMFGCPSVIKTQIVFTFDRRDGNSCWFAIRKAAAIFVSPPPSFSPLT